MTNDPLGQLLSRADTAAGPVSLPADGIAGQIRAVLRRRQARRRTATGVTLALLLVVATLIPIVRSRSDRAKDLANVRPAVEARPQEVARLRRELAAVRAQASAGETAVAAMLRAERRARRSPSRTVADPVQRIYDQRDLAAVALVRQADRLYRELDHRQSATTAYERVVALFPQTPSATVARQRLVEIKG